MTIQQNCDCALCTATRQACDTRGIRDPELREHIRDLVEAQANMLEVMAEADDAGYDLATPQVESIMDELFNSDEAKPTLN